MLPNTIVETTITAPLRDLDAAIDGSVVTPDASDWDEARLAWALSVDQQPAAVVLAESAADVVETVRVAGSTGLRIAAQGTGHNAHPLEGQLAETLLVKTARMRAVTIDPVARVARAEAGAIWSDVVDAAAEHGLAALAGSSPDVGVVGYTLGGGMSWLSRRYGLAANSVVAIEVVTADGRLVRADHENEPDLFWALRGGGGSFGVVTAIEFRLLPIREVYAGAAFWPQERAREVLDAWREWTESDLPDEVSSSGRVINFPPLDEVPEQLRGKSFVVVEVIYAGDAAEGEKLVEPFRALAPAFDTFATMPAPGLSHVHMDPEHPVPGKGDGMLLGPIGPDAIDAIVDAAGPDSGSMLLSVELRQLGGALARTAPEHGALASLEASYAMFAVGMTPVPELKAPVEASVDAVKAALSPWEAGHAYFNFSERPIDGRALYPDEYTYRRLRAVKTEYDPHDVIQSNHPIAPLN